MQLRVDLLVKLGKLWKLLLAGLARAAMGNKSGREKTPGADEDESKTRRGSLSSLASGM